MLHQKLIILFLCAVFAPKQKLHEVTLQEFTRFVTATGYVTDAQRIGVSFCAESPYLGYDCEETYMNSPQNNVLHVSFNDALAYCKWAKVRLPANEIEFFSMSDSENTRDYWDWCADGSCAGGSYLCSPSSCRGYIQGNAIMNLTPQTSSNTISFSVICQ